MKGEKKKQKNPQSAQKGDRHKPEKNSCGFANQQRKPGGLPYYAGFLQDKIFRNTQVKKRPLSPTLNCTWGSPCGAAMLRLWERATHEWRGGNADDSLPHDAPRRVGWLAQLSIRVEEEEAVNGGRQPERGLAGFLSLSPPPSSPYKNNKHIQLHSTQNYTTRACQRW